MLYFKACPRCKTGTVEHTSDPYTEYLQCVNCGFMHDMPEGASSAVLELRKLHIKARQAREAAAQEEKSGAVA